ncbi:MAG: VOC family protein [Bacillota bacterium]
MKFCHVGIPTTQKRPGEAYLQPAKLYVTDATTHPYNVEWLRFEPGSPMPKELKTMTHVAFEVDNLDVALKDKKIVVEPFVPMPGLKVAFIIDDGVLVELMQKTA